MNIQELHNRLIKRASMQKVAGPAAIALRNAIANVNKVRGKRKLVDSLEQVSLISPRLLEDAVIPLTFPNKSLQSTYVLHKLKSPLKHTDADLTKFIDKLSKIIKNKERKINNISGLDAAYEFDQSLINKYLKDIK